MKRAELQPGDSVFLERHGVRTESVVLEHGWRKDRWCSGMVRGWSETTFSHTGTGVAIAVKDRLGQWWPDVTTPAKLFRTPR